jgi:hypothetical protein
MELLELSFSKFIATNPMGDFKSDLSSSTIATADERTKINIELRGKIGKYHFEKFFFQVEETDGLDPETNREMVNFDFKEENLKFRLSITFLRGKEHDGVYSAKLLLN